MIIQERSCKGFTIVEMSIVVIIVGFLLGGIFLANNLKEVYQIRAVVSKIGEINTGVNTFEDKYRYWPGDLPNAYDYRLDRNRVTDVRNVAGTSDAQQDGDGDGVLEGSTQNSVSEFEGEMANFWVHLSNAKMIKDTIYQTYDCTTTTCTRTAGGGFPALKIGFGIIALTNNRMDNVGSYVTNAHINDAASIEYVIGVSKNLSDLDASEGVQGGAAGDNLTPTQAYSIDLKIDDGKPDMGTTKVTRRYTSGAFQDDSSLSASDCYSTAGGDYNHRVTGKVCTLRILADE